MFTKDKVSAIDGHVGLIFTASLQMIYQIPVGLDLTPECAIYLLLNTATPRSMKPLARLMRGSDNHWH